MSLARGTDGLLALPFRADNAGPDDIDCAVTLAHWYSVDLGRAAPGGSLYGMFWFDSKNGTVLALNDVKDRMPVQMLWCGAVPRSGAERVSIRLAREIGAVPVPIHVICRPAAGAIECR